MLFRDPRVVEFLLTRPKYFATIRRWNYQEGKIIKLRLIKNNLIICGKAKILEVKKYDTSILKQYLKYSGFKTIEDWIETATKLHGSLNNAKIVFAELLDICAENV
jgi:hypothetical protein